FPYTTLFRSSFLSNGSRVTVNPKYPTFIDGRSNNCKSAFPSICSPSDGLIPSARSISPAVNAFNLAALSGIDSKTTLSNLGNPSRSEEHTSELQSRFDLVCRLLLEKK